MLAVSMRWHFTVHLVCMLALLVCIASGLTGCYSVSYVHRAKDNPHDPYDLWMAALKHQEGPVYYVGSEGEFSYFRAGSVIWTRYKVQTGHIDLPRTFPLGKGDPYLVTEGMVHYR
jgi:hypothetical protein